ncbi:MAG: TIGR04282 family arsenosugar biosynthesis glycosyltransferase [Balneolaceae bacterium]|nr:TIGR04282 family arsenosugar biosynthesis glycosyltransferase [Balneolaceae bacterium]MBO6545188.1 TIGR04282 family arsenosugar biosynthesis glycosyltransferase [Balneolaceae bacterium]MBO6646584.1 TIGR04282 family arsenosugar biosynthesis glycosyltransferase [Balneolaceae bacterium]
MPSKTIKIFVKNPEKGAVKTRLAVSVGQEKALFVYEKLLGYTKNLVLDVEAQKEVWYSKFVDHNDQWSEGFFIKKLQSGSNLGERMKQAFKESFSESAKQKVVLIGSDCAELTTEIIDQAFEKLRVIDLVIGPAEDGGYYLIGMSKFIPEIFDGIDWSTESVLSQTFTKARNSYAKVSLLPKLNDVDTIEDWEKVKERFNTND